MKGLDYAFDHPDLVCVAQQGYSFVARYVGDPDPNPDKYLDAAEVKALRTLGLSIVVCRETSAGFMLTDDGGTHARIARHHCNTLGLHGIPIYYALDVDPRGLTPAQINAVTEFLQAAARADGGGHMVGLYGAANAIDRWVGADYCHWGWQTYAWSAGRISAKAHFRQHRNGVPLCGGSVDLNETYADDFGQWPRPTSTPVEEEMQFDIIGAEGNPADRPWIAIGAGGYFTPTAAQKDALVRANLSNDVNYRSIPDYDDIVKGLNEAAVWNHQIGLVNPDGSFAGDFPADVVLRFIHTEAATPQQVDVDEAAIAAAVVAALPPLNVPGAFEVSFTGAATATPTAPS